VWIEWEEGQSTCKKPAPIIEEGCHREEMEME